MSKHRRAANIDKNQGSIVRYLEMIPGVSVALKHDDILVGYRGRNYWFELKEPEQINTKTGLPWAGRIKQSQYKLLESWMGHYRICWGLKPIFDDMGIPVSIQEPLLVAYAIETANLAKK